MSDSTFQYDPELIGELRNMALDGALPVDLIRRIQKKEGYPSDYVVPVLAYLCRAFRVPLPVLLPLREEMGIGPDSNVLRVVFWFAAAMLERTDALPWDRKVFQIASNHEPDLRVWHARDDEELAYCKTEPGGFLIRGVITIIVADNVGAGDNGIQDRIRGFAEHYRQIADNNSCGDATCCSSRLAMEFQLVPDGPGCRVICTVRTLKELVVPTQLQPMASV